MKKLKKPVRFRKPSPTMLFWLRHGAAEIMHDFDNVEFNPRLGAAPMGTLSALQRRDLIESVQLRWLMPKDRQEGAAAIGIQLDSDGFTHYTELHITPSGRALLERKRRKERT